LAESKFVATVLVWWNKL